MFGDNEAVVNSFSIPHGKLNKLHTTLSYHRVCEAIASGMVNFTHMDGKFNPADILSKHWSYSKIWPQLQPLLFWKGDTSKFIAEWANLPSTSFKLCSQSDYWVNWGISVTKPQALEASWFHSMFCTPVYVSRMHSFGWGVLTIFQIPTSGLLYMYRQTDGAEKPQIVSDRFCTSAPLTSSQYIELRFRIVYHRLAHSTTVP